MAEVHLGATLTPHFREFLPPWVARQPWYPGTGTPALSPVGYFRFEDPAGEVGIETHLVAAGPEVYQIPMTYRGAAVPQADPALIAIAQHSVLGPRWIYDGEADPVWRARLLHLIRSGGVSDPSTKRGPGPAEARGCPLDPEGLAGHAVVIELIRRPVPGPPPGAAAAGLVMGTWQPQGPAGPAVTGCLAIARRGTGRPAGNDVR